MPDGTLVRCDTWIRKMAWILIVDGGAPTTRHYSVTVRKMMHRCAGIGVSPYRVELTSSMPAVIDVSRSRSLEWNSFVSLCRSKNTMIEQDPLPAPMVPGDDDRLADFLARHGGRALVSERAADGELHTRGWWEVQAADGHKLRCEWSKAGTMTHMNFTEIPVQ
jgi:hypothetical protein